jgi:hypothetical protein
MNPTDEVQVQVSATVGDIINDHINGLSGYQIAAKYNIDTERVKKIISDADNRLAFVPPDENGHREAPVDFVGETLIEPLAEGEDPSPKNPRGHK